jgi:hypothetical protein
MVGQRRFHHLTGWAGDLAAHTDTLDPGFYGHLVRLRAGFKQVAFSVLAKALLDECDSSRGGDHGTDGYPSDAVLKEIARAIRTHGPRQVLLDAYGSVPDGFVGSLAKIGHSAQPKAFYTELHSVLSDPTKGQIAQIVRQLRRIDSERLDALEALDPLFLVPRFAEKVASARDAVDLTTTLGLIRNACSRATDEALDASIRHSDSTPYQWIERWLLRADRIPHPPFDPGPDFVPLDTGPRIVEAGLRYRNCLGSRSLDQIVHVLRNRAYYWEHPRHQVIAEAEALGPKQVWVFSGVHGIANRPAPFAVSQEIEECFLRAGIGSVHWIPEDSPWNAVSRLARAKFASNEVDQALNELEMELPGVAA